MKRLFVLMLSLLTMVMFTACGETPENSKSGSQPSTNTADQPTQTPADSNSKILVAYFSRAGENYQVGVVEKGNTKIAAEMIAEATGADMFEIKTVKPYPEAYQECTEVAKKELEQDVRPDIVGKVANMDKYDTIFLCYPIWWSDLPMAVYTFLESYDFNGKTIIPFCTSAGDYMTGKEVNIPQFAKGATIREGMGMVGKRCQDDPEGVRGEIIKWLAGLGFGGDNAK